jgi:hypothetical protein
MHGFPDAIPHHSRATMPSREEHHGDGYGRAWMQAGIRTGCHAERSEGR